MVLCGYEVVKDALLGHSEEFGGRLEILLLVQMSKDIVGVWISFRNYCSLGEQKVPNCSWPCLSSVKDSTPKTSHSHFPLCKSLQLLRLLSKDSINSS